MIAPPFVGRLHGSYFVEMLMLSELWYNVDIVFSTRCWTWLKPILHCGDLCWAQILT